MHTTRVSAAYRAAFEEMRARINQHARGFANEDLHAAFDDLTYLIAGGVPALEQVPLEVAEEELRAEKLARAAVQLGEVA